LVTLYNFATLIRRLPAWFALFLPICIPSCCACCNIFEHGLSCQPVSPDRRKPISTYSMNNIVCIHAKVFNHEVSVAPVNYCLVYNYLICPPSIESPCICYKTYGPSVVQPVASYHTICAFHFSGLTYEILVNCSWYHVPIRTKARFREISDNVLNLIYCGKGREPFLYLMVDYILGSRIVITISGQVNKAGVVPWTSFCRLTNFLDHCLHSAPALSTTVM
jgi:hypothetical protein